MRSFSLKCGVVIGLMVVGLIAAAAPAAGAERPGTAKIDYIYPKDFEGVSLAVQAAPSPAAKASRLSVKLYGGYSHVAAGDVNDGIDYYFDLIEIYEAGGVGTTTGGFNPVHGGYDFGADVIYQLSPKFGLGLGFGYMRNSANSVATWSDGDIAVTLTSGATLTAMPIRLGLFFSTPLSTKLDLTAEAGAAYYAGLKLEAQEGLEFSPTEWMDTTINGSERSGADIGFHGGLGIEYRLSPKLGFFVEAVGRYAKFNNFETVTGLFEDAGNGQQTVEGKLYLATDNLDGAEVSSFTIVQEGGTVEPGYREPKIDLTGFSLHAGIHIRF